MNDLNPPPSREPIATATLDLSNKSVSIGETSSLWMIWFSELIKAVNEMQATGTTAQRPTAPPFIGFMYFDTTLGKPIWAKTATTWVDSAGTSV